MSDPTAPGNLSDADPNAPPAETPADREQSAERTSSREMNDGERAEARQYGQLEFFGDLADKGLDLGFLLVMTLLLAAPVDRWLGGFSSMAGSATLRLAAMFLITIGLHVAVSFPLSYYRGYRLDHRFGLSNLSLGGWLWRYVKKMSLAVVFGLGMFVGLYWLIWTTGSWWWLVSAVAFFLTSIVLGQLTPVLIVPLFYNVERIEDEDLEHRMSRLSEGTGLTIEGVYRLDLSSETSKANAMLAGLGATRRVLMGDTVLENFSPEEIEVIFAHEIGHHVHRHIRKMMITGAVFSAVGFWLCNQVLIRSEAFTSYAELPTVLLPLLMLTLNVFSLLLEPVQNVISRHYERQCDRYALDRTGDHEAYRGAFRKLARLNKDDPSPHWLEVALFHSHPPIAERLAMANQT